jgi:hypothetical protein
MPVPAVSFYANVTLKSEDLAVTVYLPAGVSRETDDTFYRSSRFEHGSMIGSIQRTTRREVIAAAPNGVFEKRLEEKTTELYGSELWRTPHNPYWPESGVGLASEFGVGDDGANCDLRCGWDGVDDVTNGVLGYKEAAMGQSFLKIGVGELIKGSCPACDLSEVYKFNSPYHFAKPPIWTMTQTGDNQVVLQHEQKMNRFGYRLEKTISLQDETLSVTSTLTNLGADAFRTVWYSHHLFDCNAKPIGPDYSVDLDLKEARPQLFEEPGLSGWTIPLRNFAKVKQQGDAINVQIQRSVGDGTRIKAEFLRDPASTGGFTLKGCGVSLTEDIPQVNPIDNDNDDVSMYGFNLYIEKSTFSPEPQILIHLQGGATTSWTQRIVFEDMVTTTLEETPLETYSLKSLGISLVPLQKINVMNHVGGMAFVVAAACVLAMTVRRWKSRRSEYTWIEDC